MSQVGLTPEQHLRFEKIHALAKCMGNMSLNPVEGHLNPYRDLSSARLKKVEIEIYNAFIDALPRDNIPVLLWVDPQAQSLLSFKFAVKQNCRGNHWRLLITDKMWFERNWQLLAGDLGSGVRRNVFVFIKYSKESLSRLVSPWWDPNVLMNPSVKNSRSMLVAVKSRLESGTVAFSLSMFRLASCEVYFHPDDFNIVPECVCLSAHKQDWWRE